jgi:hypothetical protein
MAEMMQELIGKADNKRIDKIELQLYQFAYKETVEKLAFEIHNKASQDELTKL